MNEPMLNRIRDAIDSGPVASHEFEPPDPEAGRLVDRETDTQRLAALFKERAESSGAKVHVVDDPKNIRSLIGEILPEGTRAAASMPDWIPDSLEYIDAKRIKKEDLFTLGAAITDAQFAVAESGSILIGAGGEQSRLTSLTAEIHVAVVKRDRIVPDLLDWAGEMEKEGDPAGGHTLISGPSKTADIELNLVVGVHGPAELHVIVTP